MSELEGRFADLMTSRPAAIADPWPLWRELRETAPVLELGPAFAVTRHADVKAILRDPARFSSDSNRRGTRAAELRSRLDEEQRRAFDEVYDFQGRFVVATDGEAHDRLRRIAHRAFTPRRIAELEAAADRYVDELVDELAQEPVVDLMQLAYRLPLMLIADLLGVPHADRSLIKGWSDRWGRNRGGAETGPLMDAHTAMVEFRAYVEAMIADHRRTPGQTDLVGALLGAEQDERMSAVEIAGMFFVLLFAGHETTTNLIGTGLFELLRNRDQWAKLCADPAGVSPAATEELLRYVTPVQWLNRVATEPVEIAGTAIPEGATVLLLLASANRDPEVFASPGTLDLSRTDAGRHVALGFGPHFCLGASLARLEGRIAFRTLAARFPETELITDAITVEGNAKLRRLQALEVTFQVC
jgi:cytochrome P450